MNSHTKNRLTETVGANNISYILNNNADFSVTGYKVMHNNSFSGMVRCAKLMYNGKIKLLYLVDGKKPLSLVISRFGTNELCTVITNILQKVIDIKANGFFLAENLNLDYDKIFVDTTDNSVHLVYFPLAAFDTGKMVSFETNVRAAFTRLFSDFTVFDTPIFSQLLNDIMKSDLPLDVVMRNFKANLKGQMVKDAPSGFRSSISDERDLDRTNIVSGFKRVRPQSAESFSPSIQPPLTLKGTNTSLRLVIQREDFIIGKNPAIAHGVITDNSAISRMHCRIIYNSGKYYIQDEGSANGTFINGNRLRKGERSELKNGDAVQLANSRFIISF